MQNYVLLGGAAVGILYFLYQLYSNNTNRPYGYGGSGSEYGGPPSSGDDNITVIDKTKKPHRNPSKDEKCVICMERLYISGGNQTRHIVIALPGCGHWFHLNCAQQLLNYHPMCPICRTRIDGNALRAMRISLDEPDDRQSPNSSKKNK